MEKMGEITIPLAVKVGSASKIYIVFLDHARAHTHTHTHTHKHT